MSTAEIPIMVTREMIEAHYKRVMTTTLSLLNQGEVARAQDLLSEAIRRPYPIPAPAVMPDAAAREDLDVWSTEEALRDVTRLKAKYNMIEAAPELLAAVRLSIAMRAAQAAYFKTRSREALIACKQAEKALDKAAALVVAKATGTARRGTQ